MEGMRESVLEILGCGNSTGVPILTCRCTVCRSRNPKNRRLRCSAWIRFGGKSILIDTSADFRQQALRARIDRVDAVLYTHPHTDHVGGIDELRCYNYNQKKPIPVYGNSWTIDELQRRFEYIFKPGRVEGGAVPELVPQLFDPSIQVLDIQGIPITPLPLKHGSKQSVGYRIGSVAYVTDCSYIPPESLDRLAGLSVLVLDCVRVAPHGTHFHLDQAIEFASRARAVKTYLTHLGHDFDYAKWSRKLPKGIHLAYDGLKIRIGTNPKKR